MPKNPSFNCDKGEFLGRAEKLLNSYDKINRDITRKENALFNLKKNQAKRLSILKKIQGDCYGIYDKNFRLLADTHEKIYAYREKYINRLEERLQKILNGR